MSRRPHPNKLILLIMLALVAWGIFHAIGAWTLNYDIRRPAIVLGCMVGFLGFWLLLLRTRRDRSAS